MGSDPLSAPATTVLVFDTGPLSHFALADWLGALKAVVGQRTAVVPDVVADELRSGGVRDDRIPRVLQAPWLGVRELRSDPELRHYAYFSSLLVTKGRNRGEAGVLALARAMSATAVLDDAAARKAADNNGVERCGTLGLLVEAIHADLLTVKLVSAVADDLLATEYRLPFRTGRFEEWATENGLL